MTRPPRASRRSRRGAARRPATSATWTTEEKIARERRAAARQLARYGRDYEESQRVRRWAQQHIAQGGKVFDTFDLVWLGLYAFFLVSVWIGW